MRFFAAKFPLPPFVPVRLFVAPLPLSVPDFMISK